MNKTAIKNFAIWARNKLIADITYKAGLLGITEKEIKKPLPQSTPTVQFFDIGTKEPYSITGIEIEQRNKLAEEIHKKAKHEDYKTAYKSVIEEVAYTWFNRLIAVRFMEVNDYLPTRIRVLSSESSTKLEPDLVTHPLEADLNYSPYEKDRIMQLKSENKLDDLFRMLFIKQCNALNEVLPELFEKTNDYTELLMNISFTDQDGVVYHLIHDIEEDDFNVSKEGQVEIIGWMYQYYIAEPKDVLINARSQYKKNDIPFVTQIFTPDWIVHYMVENSLGRLWLEGHPNDDLKSEWKYYLDEAEQEADVQKQLNVIYEEYKTIKPEDIKIIDPCMGSGHILVCAFDVLIQIYQCYGYSQRDAAKSIIENNLYGLDIEKRAYQLAYFSVMMKARQYNRLILKEKVICNVYPIMESNDINRTQINCFGNEMNDIERNIALTQIQGLMDIMMDAKEYGALLNIKEMNWDILDKFVDCSESKGQMTYDTIGLSETQLQIKHLLKCSKIMSKRYDVVITNPPYMNLTYMPEKLKKFIELEYKDFKSDTFSAFTIKIMSLCKSSGQIGLITPYVWMFLNSYKKLREKIIDSATITSLVQLEYNAFEAACVPVCTFTLRNTCTNEMGEYIKLSTFKGIDMQAPKTLEAVKNKNCGYRFTKSQLSFKNIPGIPFSYWISENYLRIFESNNRIGNGYGEPKKGLSTGENNRFLRCWFEVDSTKSAFRLDSYMLPYKWIPINKGGEFRKWYGNNTFVINWYDNGNEIKKFTGSVIRNEKYYFRKSITWTMISSTFLGVRYSEEGKIFEGAGPSLFVKEGDFHYIMGLLASALGISIVNIFNPTMNININDIANIPVIYKQDKKDKIDIIVKNSIFISKCDWDSFETSWDFVTHPFIIYKSSIRNSDVNIFECNEYLETAYNSWESATEKQFNQLKNNEEELNRLFIEIYGLQDDLTPEVTEKDVTINKADFNRDIRSFISYAVGCMFGRYSLDVDGLAYAGGEWDDSKYKTFIPDKDNIIPITDEEYFKDDVVGLFCAFIKKTFGTKTLEENLDFIAKALGNKGNSSREIIRNYFLKDFFKDHCKIYQNRPIYWLFDSGKADGFKALVYTHRYNEDTIGILRIDYLHRMQRVLESEISRMQETIENSNNTREVSAATKRKEKLVKQLKETKEYDEKIAHLALARIAIDLDDGVKVNYEKVQTDREGKKHEVLAKI